MSTWLDCGEFVVSGSRLSKSSLGKLGSKLVIATSFSSRDHAVLERGLRLEGGFASLFHGK